MGDRAYPASFYRDLTPTTDEEKLAISHAMLAIGSAQRGGRGFQKEFVRAMRRAAQSLEDQRTKTA